MSKLLGKISAAANSAKNTLTPGQSVKSTSLDALYFKDSDVLGTASSGATSCKVTISCENMKSLISKVKEFKESNIPTARDTLKNSLDAITATTVKKEALDIFNKASKNFMASLNQNTIAVNIPVTVDLDKSQKKAAEDNQPAEITEIDIAKKTISVTYKSGKDKKLIAEIKNLCVKESYAKTSTGFECNAQPADTTV